MTIEEAKAILKLAKICCEYPHGAYSIALDIAIKALEQELVLDKIILEIKEQKNLMPYNYQCGLNGALEIINKYKEGDTQ